MLVSCGFNSHWRLLSILLPRCHFCTKMSEMLDLCYLRKSRLSNTMWSRINRSMSDLEFGIYWWLLVSLLSVSVVKAESGIDCKTEKEWPRKKGKGHVFLKCETCAILLRRCLGPLFMHCVDKLGKADWSCYLTKIRS